MSRLIFLDTETTGLTPGLDKLVEIAVVEVVDRKIGASIQAYINPPVRVSPGALAIHGLTDEFLSQHKTIREVWPEFDFFIGDDEILIHNAKFDVAFLDAEIPGFSDGRRITDTLTMSKSLRPKKRKHNLDTLCAEYGVGSGRDGTHGALVDATALARVWLEMTVGQRGLEIGLDAKPIPKMDLSVRPVIVRPTAEELAEHRNFMLKHSMAVF